MIKQKLIFFLILIFLFSNISAIVLNSSNYSVGMFGTGMATGTPTSTNYNSTFLSESAGTTRGASNSVLTANIGFFETVYNRSVSISSYSISPSSAVVGSTISLSISALNSESVWAVITAPNLQTQTVTLINDGTVSFLPSPSIVGTYTVTFYANSSTGAIASAINYFTLTDSTVTPPSGGGGGGTVTECIYVWECGSWNICENGIQTRTCENKGDCVGKEGKPIEIRNCSDALFDVILSFENLVITENKTLKFNVHLIEKQGIEKIDVQLRYSIMNSGEQEIFSQVETRAVQGELSFEKELKEAILKDGKYTLRVDILYGNSQKAFAEQDFEVKKDRIDIIKEPEINWNWILLILLFIIIILIIILLAKRRKKKENKRSAIKYKNRISSHLRKIKSRNYFLYLLLGIVLIGFGLTTNKIITGFVVGSGENLNWKYLILISLVVIIAIISFVHKKKISSGIKDTKDKLNRKNLPKNSVLGLRNRKVYTEGGEFIGIIKEIIFGENRIIELEIELNKKVREKNKTELKGINVKYRDISGKGHIVIIPDKIWEHLDKSKNIKAENNLKEKGEEDEKLI